ncbi:MAG TPA: hypothetical protein VJ227_00830 [Patescibacteria group bacterium]|nr:hypothetical protein [Patescibacteria group bacterium]
MHEWLSAKFGYSSPEKTESFVLDRPQLQKAVDELTTKANSPYDGGTRNRLLVLAGLLPYGREEFGVVDSNTLTGGLDVVVEGNGERKVAFSIGIGTTALNFVNDLMLPDTKIHKSKLLAEIKTSADLTTTLEHFVLDDPKDGEKIDASKEALIRKGAESQRRALDVAANTKFSSNIVPRNRK